MEHPPYKRNRSLVFFTPFLLAILLILPSLIFAQLTQINAQTDTFHISQNGQSFTSSFTNLNSGAYQKPRLVVYFSGDFGGDAESIDVEVEGNTLLGQAGKTSAGDCPQSPDSNVFYLSIPDFENWINDGNLDIRLMTSSSVDQFCGQNYLLARLQYYYCPAGATLAQIGGLPEEVCQRSAAINLSGTPAAGSFMGPGVDSAAATFTPEDLSGLVVLRYQADDGAGCISFDEDTLRVLKAPKAEDEVVCPGQNWIIRPEGFQQYQLFDSETSLQPLATGTSLTTPPLTQSTTFYLQAADSAFSFRVDSLTRFDSLTIDHNDLSGDDRGGIAVSDSFVYIVGDAQTARYDLDLNNGISLPIRDGMFSDLRTGQLWTLYDGTTDPFNGPTSFVVTELRKMDPELNILPDGISLSEPIDMGSVFVRQNGIFAGYGFVILYSDRLQSWFAVELSSGNVTNLGTLSQPEFYFGENWADWGIAEYDGFEYAVLFRSASDNSIRRRVLPDQPSTAFATFNDLADMSSFTLSPKNQRWYFHYEGSGQFGGSNETLGYARATARDSALGILNAACRVPVTATVNEVEIGEDSVICEGESVQLFAGVGYLSYSWNGDNSNFNVIYADTTGSYVLEVTDVFGCTLSDTFNLTVDVCTGIAKDWQKKIQLYPNPTQGELNLIVEGVSNQGRISVEIMNMMGQEVLSREFMFQERTPVSFALRQLPKGQYMLRVELPEGSKHIPFIIN